MNANVKGVSSRKDPNLAALCKHYGMLGLGQRGTFESLEVWRCIFQKNLAIIETRIIIKGIESKGEIFRQLHK